jgi:hypothetical protein
MYEHLQRIEKKLDAALEHFNFTLPLYLEKLMDSLATLQAQVAQSLQVEASALTLIQGLSTRLQAAIDAAKAGDNHAALDTLSAELAQSASGLAAAVTANTVVDPAAGSTTGTAAGSTNTTSTDTSGTSATTTTDTATSGAASADPVAGATTSAPAADTGSGTTTTNS